MSRWRLGALILLLLWPLLVVCTIVETGTETDPEPPEQRGEGFADVGNNQTRIEATTTQGGASDTDSDEGPPFDPLDPLEVQNNLPNGISSAGNAQPLLGAIPGGACQFLVDLAADPAEEVVGDYSCQQELNYFVDASEAQPFQLLATAATFGTLVPGAGVEITAERVAFDGGTRTNVPLDQVNQFFVAPNSPTGMNEFLEISVSITLPAGSGPGTAGVTVRWVAQAPVPGTPGPDGFCLDDTDCQFEDPDSECVNFGCGEACSETADCADADDVCIDDGFCVRGCASTDDCDDGDLCNDDGVCVRNGCGDSFRCPTGTGCIFNQCQEHGPGRSCERTDQCEAGLRCLPQGFQDVCAECTDEVACDDGALCIDFVCVEGDECRSFLDCDAGESCEPDSGVCLACDDQNPAPPGRLCIGGQVVECTGNSDCTLGEICRDGVCVETGLCQTASDCDPGLRCCPPHGEVETFYYVAESYCDDYCRTLCEVDADCGPGGFCDSEWCDARPLCGDGTADGPEDCDGADLAGADCGDLGFAGGDLGCTAECVYDTSGCIDAVCGDGLRQGDEVCDGDDLDGLGCRFFPESDSGTLACLPDCSGFEVAGCGCGPSTCGGGSVCGRDGICRFAGTCGNNIFEGIEECDGTATRPGESCADRGYTEGNFSCNPDCTLDFAPCDCRGLSCGSNQGCDNGTCVPLSACGNGLLEFGEQCDGAAECGDFGYNSGSASCNDDCTVDLSGCNCGPGPCPGPNDTCFGFCEPATCGNGVVEGAEVCDGDNLNGGGCRDVGSWSGGTLGCAADCSSYEEADCTCGGTTCGEGETCGEDDSCLCDSEAALVICGSPELLICTRSGQRELLITCANDCVDGECIPLDETEPNDELALGQALAFLLDTRTVVDGALEQADDQDFYTFTLSDPEVLVSIETFGDPDTELFLCSAADLTCADPIATDNDSGEGLSSVISETLTPGDYYVIVDGFGAATGDYTLQIDVESLVCTPGETSCNGGDDVIEVCNDDGTAFDSFAVCAAGCDGGGLVCDAFDEQEPNDLPLLAFPLDDGIDGDVIALIDAQGGVGDVDWYGFEVEESSLASIVTTSSGAPLDTEIGLYEAGPDDALLIVQETDGSVEQLLDAGQFLISVEGFTSDQSYRLALELVEPVCFPGAERCEDGDLQVCEDDGSGWEDRITCAGGCDSDGSVCLYAFETESNNSSFSTDDLGIVIPDRSMGAQGSLPNPSDQDWYTFTLTEQNFLTIETRQRTATTTDTQLILYDDALNVLARDDDSEGSIYSRIEATSPDPGTYFVQVVIGPTQNSGPYTLTLEQLSQVDDFVVAGYQGFDQSGPFEDGDVRDDSEALQLFDFTLGANRIQGQAAASIDGPDLAEGDVDLSYEIADAITTGAQAFSTVALRDTILATSSDPLATGDVTIDLTMDYQAILDVAEPGVPGGGTVTYFFQTSQIDANGIQQVLTFDGVQIAGSTFGRLGTPCPGADQFDVTPTGVPGRLGFDVSHQCTVPVTVELGTPTQFQLVVRAIVQGGPFVPTGTETGSVKSPRPFLLTVSDDDPTITLEKVP